MSGAHSAAEPQGTLFGHPTGLFTLFFAEMWERFSYYGMRALLVFYMIKGFLGYNDDEAYLVYGAYGALVYATPFIGGMLADRLLGARRAVILGGMLMAAGHLCMTIQDKTAFFIALALIIAGNGFFKPNISTIVGSLYPESSIRRDGGFTIFYMGINLGAAMSPLLCGYVGETYGWHYGFGLATIGMLVGLAVFVAPIRITQLFILAGALAAAGGMVFLQTDNPYLLAVNAFVAVALLIAGVAAIAALNRGGLPKDAGLPPDPEALNRPVPYVGIPAQYAVYIGVVVAIPVLAFLVQRNTIAGAILTIFGIVAFGYLIYQSILSPKVERQRLWVVLILMFFSLLFWAFFEQAGSSVNNFTDRNVDRVFEERQIDATEIGATLELPLNQEMLGYSNGEELVVLNVIDAAREAEQTTMTWVVSEEDVGMGVGGSEMPASVFQAANPIFILIFGLLFTAMWGWLARRRLEPSTPFKFALGLLQLALGFFALWYGAKTADGRGMVWMGWLLLGYLFHTTGELCLSPVGLSMVTRLSPKSIVSTVMGAWFLATAFSAFLAGLIAKLTGVTGEEGSGEQIIPAPSETVSVYGDVFLKIAIASTVSAVICFFLVPVLKTWMHEEAMEHDAGEPGSLEPLDDL